MKRTQDGFTLIELMVVVLLIGILAAMALANYASMSDRARESAVKSNMHSVQLHAENFATTNLGLYPLPADEPQFKLLFRNSEYPKNPFTQAQSTVVWNAAPGAPGEIGFTSATLLAYRLKGFGAAAVMNLELHN